MDGAMPFGSLLLGDMVGTEEMRAVWTEQRMLDHWIDVERAITESQAGLGMIPEDAAAAILACLSSGRLTPSAVAERKQSVGHLMVAFLKAFREVCGAAAEHFHVGATTQDILDTALTLQMREAHRIVMRHALSLETALCAQARRQRDTVMMGRTHQQHAVPLTFGFVLAGWALAVRDRVERVREGERRWLVGSVSGAVGTQSAFVELADADRARQLEERVCEKLELERPSAGLHPRINRLTDVVVDLASLAGELGKIALDLRALQRPEVLEVEEPHSNDQQWSSTMPNKKNPEASEQVEGIAAVVRGLAGAMQETHVSDTRDSTRMPVEFVAIPLSYQLVSRALVSMARTIEGMEVHADRMAENLDHPHVLGQAAAERLLIALYRRTGRRDSAHEMLHDCAVRARQTGRPFIEVVASEVGDRLSPAELERLSDLSTYTGRAGAQTDEAIGWIEGRRADDLRRYG